MVIYIQKL